MRHNNMIKKNIALPKGGVLEVDVTQEFLKIVQKHFELSTPEQICDDHIRMYVWGAFKNAVEKVEKENVYPCT